MTDQYPSRRTLLKRIIGSGIAAATAQLSFASADFWNQKAPGDWTEDEVKRLMTRSPWAKEVNIGRLPGDAGPDDSMPQEGPGRQGRGYESQGYEIGRNRREGGARPNPTATVRWESARPILDATKETLPHDFTGHYVIAVAGLPIEWALGRPPRRGAPQPPDGATRVSDLMERLQAGATLQAKGRDSEGAGIVKRAPSDEAWLFGFSRELLPLTASDKDVEFALASGPMSIRAKFSPKEMVYKGALAV